MASPRDGEPHGLLDTWGQEGHLTSEQTKSLQSFLEKTGNEALTAAKFTVESLESVSLRFLRARSFDVIKAQELLQACVERKRIENSERWKHSSPEECTNCPLEALYSYYPHTQLGYDKFGRPLLFEHSGRINPEALTQLTTLPNLVKYHWYSMENVLDRMFQSAATKGYSRTATCAILDLEGLGMAHCSSKMLDHVKALISIDNMCYPELLGKMFIVNSPWLASKFLITFPTKHVSN